MSKQVSLNVRYLMWRKRVPSDHWLAWLTDRTSLEQSVAQSLSRGVLTDAQVTVEQLRELARAFEFEDEGETLRFADLTHEAAVDVLHENLKFLFDSLGHGGKKLFAAALGIDPTTVSRWLKGSCQPQAPSLHQIVSYFGLPHATDLREQPIFLSEQPMSQVERRRWLHQRIDSLSTDDLRELYPALRRLLEPQ